MLRHPLTTTTCLLASLALPAGPARAATCGSGGTLSANSTTCQTLTGGASLTVNSGVTLSNSSTDAVSVSSQTSGVSITNNGTISDTKAGSRAIVIKGASQTGLSIVNNGTITSSGDDAIHAGSSSTPVTSGSISLVNYGTISSTGTTSATTGQAVDFDNTSGSVVITITNYGTISAADADAVRPGANATVNNYGSITASSANGDTGNDGIDFQSHAGGTVNNYAGATITGARHGITGSGAITVNNAGTITGLLGSGINLDTTTGTTVINNAATGSIIGYASGSTDGDAIDVDYLATIENYGSILAYGTSTAGLTEAITIGGGTINNYAGGLIYSVQRAITVDDSNSGNALGATTITNAGTITGASGEAIAITSTYDNTITNSGTINGSIVITSASGTTAGNNTLTNSGTINGAVTTGSGSDTFNLYTGSTITGGIDGGAGSDTINLTSASSSGTGTLSGVSNVETLHVLAGTWTIADTQSYTNGVDIASGAALKVNGSLGTSAVTVASGGLIGGSGTVGSLALLSGATVAPGNSIGTLTVNGNYTQASGAIYTVEVDPTSSAADLINVTGTATLADGALLSVRKSTSGSYRIGTTYTVLRAAGGITGSYTLTGDTDLSAFYALAASTNATSVTLSAQQSHAFTEAALTRNQSGVASGLQGLAEGNTLRDAVGYLKSFAAARSAFDQLSGEIHASAKGLLIEDSHLPRDAALRRGRLLAQGRCAGGDAVQTSATCGGGHIGAWLQAYGASTHQSGDGNASASSHTPQGLLLGADQAFTPHLQAGLMAGYGRTQMSNAQASSGRIDNYHLGFYTSSQWQAMGLRAGAVYTASDLSTQRQVDFGDYSDLLTARPRAATAQVFGEWSYRLPQVGNGGMTAEPFAGLAYVNVRSRAFTESGGAAALSMAAGHTEAAFSTLGMRVAQPLQMAQVPITVDASLAWQHALGGRTPASTASFSAGPAFTVAGLPWARDMALAEIGLSTPLAGQITAALTYSGRFGPGTSSHGWQGRLAVQF